MKSALIPFAAAFIGMGSAAQSKSNDATAIGKILETACVDVVNG